MKIDGFLIYYFVVVVDDYLMKIIYVIRGEEWVLFILKYVYLYEVFGWEVFVFVYLLNIFNKEKKKLSKR